MTQRKLQPSTRLRHHRSAMAFSMTCVRTSYKNNVGATFYDARISNYTQFVFLPKQLAIFVVGNTATILKLDMTSFFLMDSFTLPQPTKPNIACRDPRNCKEATEISLLAMMPNEHMVWFCYVHHFQYLNRPPQHVESRCMVPQVGNLAEALVQWENPHFNSLDPRQSASILNAADGYTYISAFAPDYVRIFRAHMPDWNGRVNWTGALVTDKSRVFISEPATVLLTFETENEVYFVLREESAASKSRCIQACDNKGNPGMFEGSVSDVARLVRICKGDRGGLPHVSAENFGTFAKSDLQCQAADRDGNYYTYTHISKAYWDNSTQRLYAVFTTEKWAPMGSALCVYTKLNIQSSFDGPLLESSAVDTSLPPTPVPNSFVNICQRFNSMNLTMEELDFGRRLSLRYPNRYEPVYPLYKRALFVQTGILWIHLQVYDLPPLPTYFHFGNPARTTIIWLGSKRSLDKIVVYQPTNSIDTDDSLPVVCKLNEVHIGRSLNILKQPLDVNEQQKQHQERNRRHKGRQVPKRSAKELYLKFWRLNSHSSEIPTAKEPAEEIREVKVLFPRLFVITDRQILWLPLTDCSRSIGFEECLESKDPHCGWSWRDGQCMNGYDERNTHTASWFNTFSPSVDRRRVEKTQCPLERPTKHQKDAAWSPWYRCRWLDVQGDSPNPNSDTESPVRTFSRALGYCQCRVCLSQSECILGTQEVINCTRSERNWLDWSVWSPCDLKTGVQTRERRCRQNAICVGSSREQRFCSEISVWSNPFQDNKMSEHQDNKYEFFSIGFHVLTAAEATSALYQTNQNQGLSKVFQHLSFRVSEKNVIRFQRRVYRDVFVHYISTNVHSYFTHLNPKAKRDENNQEPVIQKCGIPKTHNKRQFTETSDPALSMCDKKLYGTKQNRLHFRKRTELALSNEVTIQYDCIWGFAGKVFCPYSYRSRLNGHPPVLAYLFRRTCSHLSDVIGVPDPSNDDPVSVQVVTIDPLASQEFPVSHICRPDGYNRCTIEQSCKNPLPVSRLNSDWSNKTPNPANKCWNEVETDKVDWIEKPLNHCGRSLDPEARYQALLEKPPGGNTLERSDRKRTGFSRKFTASQQPLLSGSPVPSPISIPSGLSTASMCIRDKFTFEHLTDPPEDPKASLTQPPSMVLDLKHTNSPVLCMNKYLTASGNCDSAENSSVERSLNTPQCGRNSEHRKGVEPNCFHENN
ncbi:semaphorin-5B [Clonorchis sinensis]|uniref:Semaphorin-5B n=1 Tax=Clonorchis sinensis TaxID=79923 RepID=G7YIP7_CLOSI|nr:semaphorin-5B [Clonorchis sinensis]